MINIHINYPNKRIATLINPDCRFIQHMNKPDQRYIKINRTTVEKELKKFQDNLYRFNAKKAFNDTWLEIYFEDYKAELAVL